MSLDKICIFTGDSRLLRLMPMERIVGLDGSTMVFIVLVDVLITAVLIVRCWNSRSLARWNRTSVYWCYRPVLVMAKRHWSTISGNASGDELGGRTARRRFGNGVGRGRRR